MRRINYILVLLFCFFTFPALSQIELPTILADGAILQRGEVVSLRGSSSKNQKIKLSFNNQELETKTNTKGKWELEIPPQAAGGPYEFSFYSENDSLVLKNIYFGDVWLCSGQSNMETTMERVSPKYPKAIGNSENERIRQFLVGDDYHFKSPLQNVKQGSWKAANPDNLPEFSAVAYFFAKKVYEETGVPIGLINSAVGGSPVEAWMNEESLKSFPDIYEEHLKYRSDSLINAIEEENHENSAGWNEKLSKIDKGLQNNYIEKTDLSDWKSTEVPGYWQENGILDSAGVIWYKKEFLISEKPVTETAQLNLGRLIDSDQVYINGKLVGQTGYQYPPRRYPFDTNLLNEGKNLITVRLVNNSGQAGFVEGKPYNLKVGKDSINLEGTWKYKVGATMPNMKGQRFVRWKPGGLYNAMIAPLHDLKIKGILWYQGESNAGNPQEYKQLFPKLISSWRTKWNNNELPFLYVQLPNFMKSRSKPGESNWAEMREIQRNLKDSLSNTGMAVTIDIGEWNDIHPLNKKDVGERLALQAFAKVYDLDVVSNSPEPKSWQVKERDVFISFKDVGSGLKLKQGDSPKEFAISENGENYYWAEAEIVDEKTIKLTSSEVAKPKFVRYAWADNPDQANLYNSEDLPASPFQLKLD